MIHWVVLPSLSSLKAWMHSGATETLRGWACQWGLGLSRGQEGGACRRTRMTPARSHVSWWPPPDSSIATHHDALSVCGVGWISMLVSSGTEFVSPAPDSVALLVGMVDGGIASGGGDSLGLMLAGENARQQVVGVNARWWQAVVFVWRDDYQRLMSPSRFLAGWWGSVCPSQESSDDKGRALGHVPSAAFVFTNTSPHHASLDQPSMELICRETTSAHGHVQASYPAQSAVHGMCVASPEASFLSGTWKCHLYGHTRHAPWEEMLSQNQGRSGLVQCDESAACLDSSRCVSILPTTHYANWLDL